MKNVFSAAGYLTGLLLLLAGQLLSGQTLPLTYVTGVPTQVAETSGLLVSNSNKFWSHNDSGDGPQLYCFDSSGVLLRTLYVRNASNVDWEEVTRDTAGRVYLGDFGNNLNNRGNLRIYRIPNPDTVVGDSVTAEIIAFSYPDQVNFPPVDSLKKFDMEAMVAHGDSLFLFSKNRTAPFDGYTRRYRLPQDSGTYVATLVDSFYTGPGPLFQYGITGAALSPNQEHLILTSSDRCWFFSCFSGTDYFGGSAVQLQYSFTQKEAVAWLNDQTIYLTDEVVNGQFGGDLYRANVATWTAEPQVFLGNDTTLTGDSLLLNAGGLTQASYLWNTGAVTPLLWVDSSGSYSIAVTAPNGCTAHDTIEVTLLTGLSGHGLASPGIHLQVGPNPVPETFSISYELSGAGQIHFDLLDASGRKVQSTQPVARSAGQYQQQLRAPATGIFTLRVLFENQVVIRKLVHLR